MALHAHGQRTDLNDASRLPGEAPAGQQGQKVLADAAASGLPQPGGRGGLMRPTERPGEPVTAGQTLGPGPGPSGSGLSEADKIRSIYRAFPSEELRQMVEFLDRRQA